MERIRLILWVLIVSLLISSIGCATVSVSVEETSHGKLKAAAEFRLH